MNRSKNVMVLIGAGPIGKAIARWVGGCKHMLLADIRQANADIAVKFFCEAGF